MINFTRKPRYGYADLLEIIRLLRSPEGCPWDRVQTHQSIRRGMLEEAYEAAEAIDNGDTALLREELGDVLMQVVFHADIEKDAGHFTMDDVCDGVVKKLLFRHPHVFGGGQAETAETVPVSWEELKRQEKGQQTTGDALDAVARSLPGLWRAEKIQKKAADAGFDWRDTAGALDKLDEEVRELREAVERFDDQCIVLRTGAGVLVVSGEELHIGKLSLDGGELHVDGRIDALSYEDAPEERGGGLLHRLFG